MRSVLVFVLAAVVLACGASTSNRCPSSAPTKCLTNEVCTWDPDRKCQVCHCDQPTYEPIGKPNPPSGTPPPGP